jgi:hypothetical protein
MSNPNRPLLPDLQGIIERTYGMPRVIADPGAFLIGDAGLRAFHAGHGQVGGGGSWGQEEDESVHRTGARVLVRHHEGSPRIAVYYPDSLVRHLERHDPRRGIDDDNIDAFAVLVEELDHLLVIASRAALRRSVSLLELEIHAGVTKYLVVIHFLGRLVGRRRLSEFHRLWARHHLFGKYAAGRGENESRYLEAARLARRYVSWLDRLSVPARRAELLDFDRRGLAEKVGWIERVA